MNKQSTLKDKQGVNIIPNTTTTSVADVDKHQSLRQTLIDIPDKGVLGFEDFATIRSYSAGEVVYYNNKLWRFTSAKAEGAWDASKVEETSLIKRVELECADDQHITIKGDATPLTYDEVKALVDDPTKFVTLRYLDMWWMLPSYDDGGAIMFTSSDIQGGHVMVTRVILNDDEQMNNYSIMAEDIDHKTDDMSVETAPDGHKTYPATHAVNDALTKKANTDGYYTELTSGFAEQILSPDGVTDTAPYIYRTSAGDTSISTGVAEVKKLEGNSVVWNQLLYEKISGSFMGVTYKPTNDNKGTILTGTFSGTVDSNSSFGFVPINKRVGHKFYNKAYGTAIDKNLIRVVGSYYGYPMRLSGPFEEIKTWTLDFGSGSAVQIYPNTNAVFDNDTLYIVSYDLTQMFGAGNEPTSIEEFHARKPKVADEYAYNEGEIVNVNVDGLVTTGFNQWDGDVAKVFGGKQYQITGAYSAITLDGESVTPTSEGLFTPSHNGTLNVVGADDTTCVHLTWSGYRNGEYEPYEEHRIALPVSEIVDAEGNVMFPDGLLSAGTEKDEITSVKAVKRIGVVDLGSLDWTKGTYAFFDSIPNSGKEKPVCEKYYVDDNDIPGSVMQDKTLSFQSVTNQVYVRDSAYTTASAFKTAMQGVMLYYELAEPKVVDFAETPQTFGEKLNLTYHVDDFGTEEYTIPEGKQSSAVNHATFYMTNLRDKIRTIDGNTDSGALMNPSLDNLLTTLGTAMGGTLTKAWDATNKRWTFSFTPATNALEEGGAE